MLDPWDKIWDNRAPGPHDHNIYSVFFASGAAFVKMIFSGTMLRRYSSKNVFSGHLWLPSSTHSIPPWKYTMHTSIFKFLRILPVKKLVQPSGCQTYLTTEIIFFFMEHQLTSHRIIIPRKTFIVDAVIHSRFHLRTEGLISQLLGMPLADCPQLPILSRSCH